MMIPPYVPFHPKPCGKLVIVFDHGVSTSDKKVPLELGEERGTVGASHGWLATLKDGVLRLQDDLNLSASDVDPKRISLPPLVTLPHCQTQVVTNIAMSCSSPEEDDCVVAIKFLGPQLSFCRPAQRNSQWINIEIRNSSFYSSPVMFSKKDEMFRMPSSGGHLIGSWDLHRHMHKPKLLNVRFRNLPKLTKSMCQLLDSCYRSEHLVESPGGCGTFMVKWYRKKTRGLHKMKTKAVMVFKLDDQGNAVYTQDIGDVSIFLSRSEPFCVSTAAGSYLSPVDPNHVYIQDYDEHGFVNIGIPLRVDADKVISGHTPKS
ncbi:unnamed protein product [Microthlaspi erraticum]|uniref:KIB1-4 beta-propeller domain-containing protein n=1 Tax=Microthlaspi erraticum TaxID=1685480 RepID=A0A6D2L7H4_9BRAS|nr:unnamed protein product [Microthlaspi erraticum]